MNRCFQHKGGLLVILIVASASGQDSRSRLAAISGVVTTDQGQVLSGARVTLTGDPSLLASQGRPPISQGQFATTDAKGKYTIMNVSPGTYLVSAQAPGYVKQAYGGKPGYFGSFQGRVLPLAATPIHVMEGAKIVGLDIRLTRLSNISGRVTTEDREPASSVPVSALRWTYLEGSRRLIEQGAGRTDGNGDFQITGLAPGQYFIYASPPMIVNRPGEVRRNALPTFAPNALRVSEATSITLAAGNDGFADIRLHQDPQFTVRGRVVGADGEHPPAGATILLMQDRDTPLGGDSAIPSANSPPAFRPPYIAIARADVSGEFALEGILPGHHRLIAFGGQRIALNLSTEGRIQSTTLNVRGTPTSDDASAGAVDIAVGDHDVDHVSIQLRKGGEITSRIALQGTTFPDWTQERMARSGSKVPEKQMSALLESVPNVTLIPEAGVSFGGNFPGRSSAGNVQKVSTGRYFLDVSGANRYFYVKSIRLGGVDITRKPFEFNGGSVDLEILMATDAGSVSGAVMNRDGDLVRGAPVSLWPVIPDNTRRDGGAMLATSGFDGSYTFPFVAPGEFYVMAFEDLPDPGLAQYPAFVSQFTASAKRVKVEPEKKASENIKSIATREVERALANLQ